jgi:transposase-like protein
MNTFDKPIFHDDDVAREYLEDLQWPDGVVCPHCGCVGNSTKLQGKKHRAGVWKCNDCRKQFTVTVGTVFENSHIPLHTWLYATHLLCSSKKGISAHQLHRTLGVTYKTALFMAHRIREAMSPNGLSRKLGGGIGGTVEADETFIGNIPGEPIHGGGGHKQKVFSIVERGGQVRSWHVENIKADTLVPLIEGNVSPGTMIYTDEARQYKRLDKMIDFPHDIVSHEYDEYVRGDVYTNTIEGFFSIFKRGMKGVYQHCSGEHLKRYLAEFDFRYNSRDISDAERTSLALKGIHGKRLYSC